MVAVPTPEQQEIIDCTGNVVVTARPGSGKTFTLARMIAKESEKLLSYQGIIAISYTNKASDELEQRCKKLGARRSRSFFGTIDSFCFGQIIAPFAKHIIGHIVQLEIIEDIECEEWLQLKGRETRDPALRRFLKERLNCGQIPISALGETALLILDEVPQVEVYLKSRYTSVYIDEYQDCGLCQHQLMKRLVLYGLRSVAVGDIDQAIFRFADKSPKYLIELMKADNYSKFWITKNHRCNNAIQSYSLALLGLSVNSIERNDRRVFAVHIQGDETNIAHGIASTLMPIMNKYNVDGFNNIAIIGFSNRVLDHYSEAIGIPSKRFKDTPLDRGFTRWRRMLSDLLSCYYAPFRYSGTFLDRYLGNDVDQRKRNRGLALVDEFFSIPDTELYKHINLVREIAELCEPKLEREGDLELFTTTVEDVKALRRGFRPAQNDEINILTYHKAKGLEYDIVFCLETYEYILPPTRYDEKPYDAYGQSLAMHYVGITRAKKACYIMLGTGRHNKLGEWKPAKPSQFLNLPGLSDLRIDSKWE